MSRSVVIPKRLHLARGSCPDHKRPSGSSRLCVKSIERQLMCCFANSLRSYVGLLDQSRQVSVGSGAGGEGWAQ